MRIILALVFLLVACRNNPPGYPVTPQVAERSTFLVEKSFGGVGIGTGTAWIVEHDHAYTYLMTAGHVCDDMLAGMAEYKLIAKNTPVKHHVEMAQQIIRAKEPDLCILKAPGDLGPSLLLSEGLPEYGEEIAYVGAPIGIYGQGVAPLYFGRYIGNRYISAPGFGGASGSAVFTPNGVFGVLVTYNATFNNILGFVPIQEIEDFLWRAGFKKHKPSAESLKEELDESNQ